MTLRVRLEEVVEVAGQLASMIWAAIRLVAEDPGLAPDVALLFVVGEELDHVGMTVSPSHRKLRRKRMNSRTWPLSI